MSYFDSIKFLWELQFGKNDYNIESVHLGKNKFETDVYRPKTNSKGTIITINGLAPLGPKDPRFRRVNESFVRIGYTVVSPFLKEICEFKISKQNVADIVQVVESVKDDLNNGLPRNIGIFAPSFSGGLSLIAATDPRISSYIQSMILIGSYSKVDELIQFLFENQDTDEYGRMILLWNFISLSLGERPNLKKALELAILDNYFKRIPGDLDSFWDELSKEDKEIFYQVKENPQYRIQLWNDIVKKGGANASLLRDLSVEEKLKNIQSPIILIHGKSDDVVPCSQSRLIYEELQRQGIKSKLCVTNLLGHGDTGFSTRALWELFPLISSFAFFFQNMKK